MGPVRPCHGGRRGLIEPIAVVGGWEWKPGPRTRGPGFIRVDLMLNSSRYISLKPPAARRRDPGGDKDLGFYDRAAWRRLRAWFLAANPLCWRCLERDELVPAEIAHHIIERLERPDLALDPANLMALCWSCHSKLHAKDGIKR